MNILDKEVYISLDHSDEYCRDLLLPFHQLSVETKSCTGFEITTYTMQFIELIVAVVSMPIILEAIKRNLIIVTIGGCKFNDFVSCIIEKVNSDPLLLEQARQAYNDNTLLVEGTAKECIKFRKNLQALLDSQGENE